MNKHIGGLSLLVDDYDRAIDYYTNQLDFLLLEDTDLGNGKRWVRVAPSADAQTTLLLAKAKGASQEDAIGNQSGGRVFLFLITDNFDEDFEKMKNKGIQFEEEPRTEPFGKVAIFKDVYGNRWDFIQYFSQTP